jgi:hypothetical protein
MPALPRESFSRRDHDRHVDLNGRGSTWPLALAAAAVVLALSAIALSVLLRPATPPDPSAAVVSSTASTEPPPSAASAAEIQRLHRALHDLGKQCQEPEGKRSQPSINRDVDIILAFAKRYPEGRFPIDDETGSALSLLLVARNELRPCAPAAAARVDSALPPEFREPTPRR